MATQEKQPATIHELLISALATNDALAKLLIEKGTLRNKNF